jgi:SulP family sulfate permease
MNIKKYNFITLKKEIFGGITAAVVALPLGLAFGISSGLGALTGLYGAILVGFFASLFGGTPKQISGPTGPMTIIVALIFIEFEHRPEVVFFCITLAGFFQVFFGLFKFGNLIKVIPLSVVSGFMTGIGLIIISLQLPVIFGLGNASTIILSFLKFQDFYSYNTQSVILGFISLVLLFIIPSKISKIIPSPITVLIFGTLLSLTLFNQQDKIGEVPNGIPKLKIYFPFLIDYPKIIFYSLLLSLLGIIDSLLTSMVADKITNDIHDPNKETVGQGIGNIIAGLFGGLAGAGATMRTVVNIQAGGQTKISGIIHSIVLLIFILSFSSVAEIIPLSVLAAILIKVGIDIIDWNFIKNYKKNSIVDIITNILVIILTIFINLIIAVFAGVLFYYLSKYIKKYY